MHRSTIRWLGIALLIGIAFTGILTTPVGAEGCTYPETTSDATGTEVTITDPADRVVVLDPASAQVFWEIDAADHVVGLPVGDATAYLDGAANRTDITGDSIETIRVEQIIALEPDLVVAPNYVDETTITQLRDKGIPVYQQSSADSIAAIYQKTRQYGQFVGACDAANETATDMQTTVEAIKTATANDDAPRVLYYFFGYSAGNGTFIAELIEAAGGDNVATTAGIDGYQQLSKEVIARSETDPEWIVAPSSAAVPVNETPFSSTTAVQSGNVLIVDDNLISQAGPRVVVPLHDMASAFYPNATLPTVSSSEPSSSTSPDPSQPQPGFGILAVVCCLSIALFLHRRD